MAEKVTRSVDVKVGAPGVDQAKRQLSGLGQTLKDLNKASQGAGLTGDSGLVSMLKGGGALMSVKFIADGIREGVAAWKDFKSGALDAVDAMKKVSAAIPVVGSVVDATFAIADLFSNRLEIQEQVARYMSAYNTFVADSRVKGRGIESARDAVPGLLGYERNTPPQLTALTKGKKFLDEQREAYESGLLVLTEKQKEDLYAGLKEYGPAIREMQGRVLEGLGGLGVSLRDGLIDAGKTFVEKGITLDLKRDAEEMQKKIELDMGVFMANWHRKKEAMQIDDLEWGWLMGGDKPKSEGVLSRTATTVDSRFLTGAIATNPNTNAPEERTARESAKTNQLLQQNLEAIRDLGRALRENPALRAIPMY